MVHTFLVFLHNQSLRGMLHIAEGETHPGAKLNSGLKKFVVTHKTDSGWISPWGKTSIQCKNISAENKRFCIDLQLHAKIMLNSPRAKAGCYRVTPHKTYTMAEVKFTQESSHVTGSSVSIKLH